MTTRTTRFFYDAVGNRTKVIDPDSRTTYYTYDKVNRLTGISVNPDSKSASYRFNPAGRIKTELKPNSAVTYYEYDDAGRLTRLENLKSDLSVISSFQYDRDKAGNITMCYRADGATIYYEYDKAWRLASEVWKDSGMSTIYSYQYDYDGVGNRTRLLRNLGSGAESIYYYYDAANRLEKEWNPDTPSTTYFGYNDNGSVTKIQTSSGTTYFEYNDSDLVDKITYPDASTNEFHYDGRKQRVVIKDSSGASYFQWDGINPIEEKNASGYIKYVHGYALILGVGSLAYSYFTYDNKYQIPHKDNIGSTKELTDASAVVVQYYDYDAFGTELKETGSQANRFLYSANYVKLEDLDNVFLSPTRVYHAGVGRFLQKDPVEPAIGFYLWVGNSPLRFVDPTGLWKSGDPNQHGELTEYANKRLLGRIGTQFTDNALKVIIEANVAMDGKIWTVWSEFLFNKEKHWLMSPSQLESETYHEKATEVLYNYYARETIKGAVKFINEQWTEVIRCASGGDYKSACKALGKLLHTVQDRYAHTDYTNSMLFWEDPEKVRPLLWDPISEAFIHPTGLEISGWHTATTDNPKANPGKWADAKEWSELIMAQVVRNVKGVLKDNEFKKFLCCGLAQPSRKPIPRRRRRYPTRKEIEEYQLWLKHHEEEMRKKTRRPLDLPPVRPTHRNWREAEINPETGEPYIDPKEELLRQLLELFPKEEPPKGLPLDLPLVPPGRPVAPSASDLELDLPLEKPLSRPARRPQPTTEGGEPVNRVQ